MKNILLSFIVLLLIGAGCTNYTDTPQKPTESNSQPTIPKTVSDTYIGAWFEISYPSGFTIFEREKSPTAESDYDGVSFISPDSSAEFYIYSPQWRGESIWENIQNGETIFIDKDTNSENGLKINTKVIQNTQENFYRTIEVVEMYDAKYVFGFRYKDDQVYNLYKDTYEEFKSSLIQFAD